MSDDIFDFEGEGSTERDDIFVREYVRSGRSDVACVRAGLINPEYPIKVIADRQMARPEIQRRIAEATEGGQKPERVEYSRELILDELQAIHDRAFSEHNFPSAINALKTQAAMMGMMDQTVNVNHTVGAKGLSLQELRALVAQGPQPGDNAIPARVIERPVEVIEMPSLLELAARRRAQ
jgi:hypothetical protein